MESAQKTERINQLCRRIELCRRCRLHATRTRVVAGEGSVDAVVMFIGEAPGRNEDLQGRPFVGRAGEVFDRLLSSIGLTRSEIYLCNILKCRPPANRNPSPDEIAACIGSLDIQIATINPAIIAPMGNFAAAYILGKFLLAPAKISAVHGTVYETNTPAGVKAIVPLFHPAVVTYNNSRMAVLQNDFLVLKKTISRIRCGAC